jgi:hypothetical protein
MGLSRRPHRGNSNLPHAGLTAHSSKSIKHQSILYSALFSGTGAAQKHGAGSQAIQHAQFCLSSCAFRLGIADHVGA